MRCRAGEEAEQHREDDEVGEEDAKVVERRTGDDQRQYQLAFMLVEPRGNKGPDLVEHIGDGQKQRDVERQLHRDDEGGGHIGGDHLAALGQALQQGQGQQMIDVVGKVEQGEKQQADRSQRSQQAAAQLEQMADQRLLVGGHDLLALSDGLSAPGTVWRSASAVVRCGELAFNCSMALWISALS